MAAPDVAIRRLSTRVLAAAPEDAFSARALVDQAVRRLGPGLDRALERAGVDAEMVVALPRLAVRLDVEGEASPAELGDAWAEALARAIVAALPGARALPARAAPTGGSTEMPVHFRDAWEAEAAVLRALAEGAALPWWAAQVAPDARTPDEVVAVLLGRWIERDAPRAAGRMATLLIAQPAVARMLDARQAAVLAARLVASWRGAFDAIAPGTAAGSVAAPPGPVLSPEQAAAIALVLERLPAPLRAILAALPADRRGPWIAAALLAFAPSRASALPLLVARLASLAATAWTPAEAPRREATTAASSPLPAQVPDAATEVWCGGLLLLIRPLARLRPEWLALGDGLPARLLTLGLIALRRLAAPLPPAARRAALERDRLLLGIFAGSLPPDGPLEEAPLDDGLAAEAEAALAAITAAVPAGTLHVPGALRRAYGHDPFARDAPTDTLCRLLLRPGRLIRGEASATLIWPPDAADIALRRAAWDSDPGWVPWLGRRITFRFETS